MNPLQRGLAVVGLLVLLGDAAWLVSALRHQPASIETTTPPASVVLDKAPQLDIWRAEHTTFEIERRFGPAFLEALNDRDLDRLAALATPDLKALGLGAAPVTERRHGDVVELSRARDPHEQADSLTARGPDRNPQRLLRLGPLRAQGPADHRGPRPAQRLDRPDPADFDRHDRRWTQATGPQRTHHRGDCPGRHTIGTGRLARWLAR